MTRKTKDKDSTLDYVLDWSAWLDGDTIAAVTWAIPAGLTKTNESHTTTTATIWLSGGQTKSLYPVNCRIATTNGRVEDYSFELLVTEK